LNAIKGAILGDYSGSGYEHAMIKGASLPLTLQTSCITDDSVMTFATLDALLTRRSFQSRLVAICNAHADVRFGDTMTQYLAGENPSYLSSNSNGAAIRMAPIACLNISLDNMLRLTERNAALTHTGEEAIKGASALTEAIYLARTGNTATAIKQRIERKYGYCLTYDANDLFHNLEFTTAAAITVPIAIWLGLTARNPEHCLRLGLHVGGDTDSIMSMATALAASFPGAVIPEQPYAQLLRHLSINYPDFKALLEAAQTLH